MKSCLGTLILLLALGALAVTAAYHVTVNAELRFTPRESHDEYINTTRSYRPPKAERAPADAAEGRTP